MIFYTGKVPLNLPKSIPKQLRIVPGRPDLLKTLPDVIRSIESKSELSAPLDKVTAAYLIKMKGARAEVNFEKNAVGKFKVLLKLCLVQGTSAEKAKNTLSATHQVIFVSSDALYTREHKEGGAAVSALFAGRLWRPWWRRFRNPALTAARSQTLTSNSPTPTTKLNVDAETFSQNLGTLLGNIYRPDASEVEEIMDYIRKIGGTPGSVVVPVAGSGCQYRQHIVSTRGG